jgi:UMF1 family MFS transporter
LNNFASFSTLSKQEKGWIAFDWANSSYQLSITSALFPAFYHAVSKKMNHVVNFGNTEFSATSIYAFTMSAAFLTVAIVVPYLSSIADYTGRRKLFMIIFTSIGAISAMGLGFLSQYFGLGLLFFYLATVGYAGSLTFYNSFLPLISSKENLDRISALGYSFGYIGSVILLVLNLITISFPSFFGLPNELVALQVSFVMVGLWWFGFAQFTFKRLPKYAFANQNKNKNWWKGYQEIVLVWNEFKKNKVLIRYLLAYFFCISGILTVMYMAANFGKKELELKDGVLIPTVLLIQLFGIHGAMLCSSFSKKYGNIKTLAFVMFIWILICLAAYFVHNAWQFILLAISVGYVMGGAQSLLRSTYAKLLPETKDHTSYFSFFDVVERLAMIIGLFGFGLIEQITGSMRFSIVLIAVMFIAGLVVLSSLKKHQTSL